jgi:DNA-binding response OmpR family regulator
MARILIADDHKQITSILEEYVKKEGHVPIRAKDGEEALFLFKTREPDIILLDVMMPKIDGFELCGIIRKTSRVPIIMITARGEDFERIMGLDTGADDYIVKPFSPGEVMARIRAILRRIDKEEGSEKEFAFDNLKINLNNYCVTVNDHHLPLTKREIEILWTLAMNKNKVFTRDNLLDSLWGQDYFGDSRTVDSHIKRLRAKLNEFPHPAWTISTIWGVGYKFEETENDQK